MIRKLTILLLAVLTFACEPIETPQQEEPPQTPVTPAPKPADRTGVYFWPEQPDADGRCVVVFIAGKKSPLYNYTGNVYAHTGIADAQPWSHVQAAWNENKNKCRMVSAASVDSAAIVQLMDTTAYRRLMDRETISEDHKIWFLDISPSIREWYGTGDFPVKKIGVVIRNSDGSKKGVNADTFCKVTDTKYQFAAGEKMPVPAGMEYGINYRGDDVTLVLYEQDNAGKSYDYAYVVGDFSGWKPADEYRMFRDDASGCWWYTFTGVEQGREYRFQYYLGNDDSAVRIQDPYSRIIYDTDNDRHIASSTYPDLWQAPSGVSGLVSAFRTGETPYAWEVPDFSIEDKDDLIIYELLLRDFTANGTYEGNLALAMEKLDYIEGLGVNAIELMPVQEFDGNDSWGYSPNSFFAVDKAYGTKEMYKKFIDECHKRGIAVFFDVVYNHATGSCALAKMYWEGDATAASNPWFNVKAKHPFNVYHDMNHESEFVRAFVKRNLKYLLEEFNIDGFRFDLTKGFTQNNTLGNEAAWSRLDESRVTILKDYADAVWDCDKDAVVIFEHLSDNSEEKKLAEHGIKLWRKMCEQYGQTAMGYSSKSSFGGLYSGTDMPFGSLVGYMESHDEERLSYKQTQWGVSGVKDNLEMRMKRLALNAAFFFTVPGPKMIWQFGELGYDYSINYPSGTDKDRTGKKPVKWDYKNNPARKNLYDTYCSLIAFRRAYPSFFDSDATFTWKVGTSDWSMRYIHCTDKAGKSFVVVGNFSTEPSQVTLPLPSAGVWKTLDGNFVCEGVTEKNLDLQPAEYVILVDFDI